MADTEGVRLDEFSKDEWREVARRLRPDMSDGEFELAWTEFCELKRRKHLH